VLRAIATDGTKPVVLLGLDPQNFNRLREGQPIQVNLANLGLDGKPTGLPDIDVVVFYGGKDEMTVLADAWGDK
jgi:hypothetical protein